jgi:hypothetical protein
MKSGEALVAILLVVAAALYGGLAAATLLS